RRSIFSFAIAIGFLINACSSGDSSRQEGVIKTTYGEVSGYQEDGLSILKGITYAKAERFMPPQDPDKWNGVRECTEFSRVARQVVAWIPDSSQNEKELFTVNVWTPAPDGKKRPVMFWLHGGGFHVGSSNDPMTYG